MTGHIVAVLLALASATLMMRRPMRGSMRGSKRGRAGGRGPRAPLPGAADPRCTDADHTRRDPLRSSFGTRATADHHDVPLFVHQLAGLLRAGRPPGVLWADIESVYREGQGAFSDAARPMIGTARRAAELGLSVPDALRQAVAARQAPGRRGVTALHESRLWTDLAGCLEVAEKSGAPLAGILGQYAGQLDAELDGLSARDTALAGPRATVVLLTWLPAVGLVLGFALGINPVKILTGSVPGQLALSVGLVLMLASRLWSRRLVLRAAGSTT